MAIKPDLITVLLSRLVELLCQQDARITALSEHAQRQSMALDRLAQGEKADREALAMVKARALHGQGALLSLLTGPKVLPLLTALATAILSYLVSHIGVSP